MRRQAYETVKRTAQPSDLPLQAAGQFQLSTSGQSSVKPHAGPCRLMLLGGPQAHIACKHWDCPQTCPDTLLLLGGLRLTSMQPPDCP